MPDSSAQRAQNGLWVGRGSNHKCQQQGSASLVKWASKDEWRGVVRKGFSATKTLVSASAAPPVTLGASEGVNIPLDLIYVSMRSERLFAWGLCLQPPGQVIFVILWMLASSVSSSRFLI